MARRKSTHCMRGHAYNSRNTHVRKSGKRVCLRCHADYQRLRYWAAPERRERLMRKMHHHDIEAQEIV